MNVNPVNPLGRRHGVRADRQAAEQKPAAPDRADQVRTFAARIDRDTATEKARDVAELIRRRRESGHYHRADVVRTVALRLLESGDLDRFVLPDF